MFNSSRRGLWRSILARLAPSEGKLTRRFIVMMRGMNRLTSRLMIMMVTMMIMAILARLMFRMMIVGCYGKSSDLDNYRNV